MSVQPRMEKHSLYFAREKKGHEGVKGTVAENHQECLAHVLR